MNANLSPTTRRFILTAGIAVLPLAAPFSPEIFAQAPPVAMSPDAREYDAAEKLFAENNHKDAAVAFEKFLEKYKMLSPRSLDAKFRLAVSNLHLKQYDESLKHLRDLVQNQKIDVAAREMAQLLIAKAITMKGFELPADSDTQKANQKKIFADALKEYDTFLATYPRSADLDGAHFLRATLLLQSELFDEAVKGFATVARIPGSPFAWESVMWVGKAYFIQASSLLETKGGKEPTPENVKAALALFDKALPSLSEAYAKSGDLGLMNEAVFFVGQMQLTRSQQIEGGDEAQKKQRAAVLEQSLEAFRAVRSVEEVLQVQDAKIADLEKRMTLVQPGPGYMQAKNRLENLIGHEIEKKDKYKSGQDQALAARLAIARIFLFLGKTDEARALIRHLLGQKELFANDKEAQANIASLLCLTYAEQKNAEKSLAAYQEFTKEFRGNPVGDNLPLVVANVLVETGKPEEAEKLVAEGMKDYKNWRFATESMQILTATALKKNDYKKALELCDKLLTSSPKPEVELQMLFIKASVQQAQALESSDAALADAALATFKTVRDKFPDSPQAEDAWFNSAQILAGRDPAKAIEELNGYLGKYANGGAKSENTTKSIPTAQYLLGTAFDRTNQKDKAIEAWRAVMEKHPESEPAPGAYFKVFDFLNEKKDYPAAMKLMEEFVAKYPKHENVYFAYNNVAEFLFSGTTGGGTQAGVPTIANVEAGTKKLLEYVDYETSSGSGNKRGDGALTKVATRWLKEIAKLPPYLTLNETQRGTWKMGVDGVIGAVERMLKDYPESERASEALEMLVTAQNQRRKAQQADSAQVEAYFKQLLEQHGSSPLLKARIQMALAAFLSDTDEKRAFAVTDEAFKSVGAPVTAKVAGSNEERVVPTFTPSDYDRYLAGLFDAKRTDDVTKLIERIKTEYPMGENEQTGLAANRARDDAQAVALFWEAKLQQEQGKMAEAGAKFASLKEKFPKSAKALESDYGVILGEFEQKQEVKDDYIQRLTKVVNTPTGKSFELQAKSLFLIGRIQEAKKDIDGAIETYEKIQLRYASVPKVAIAGLWKAAELAEKQARAEPGYPVKTKGEKRAAAEARAAEAKAARDASKQAEPKPADAKPADEKPPEPGQKTAAASVQK